jgi:hypothetical protein
MHYLGETVVYIANVYVFWTSLCLIFKIEEINNFLWGCLFRGVSSKLLLFLTSTVAFGFEPHLGPMLVVLYMQHTHAEKSTLQFK